MFFDLIEQIKAEDLLPAKRLGPLVCIAVVEGSSHPKARLLACKECYDCVEKIGLSGIGKRGVLAVAKALSEEKLQENRNALLDLVVLLVSKMNGDLQRFTRICGSSLSGKARSLIEEQLSKGGTMNPTGGARTTTSLPSPKHDARRSSIVPHPVKATPSRLPSLRTKTTGSNSHSASDTETGSGEAFRDELPALDLRFGSRGTPSAIPRAGTVERTSFSSPSKVSPSIQGSASCSDSDELLNQILGTNKAAETTPSEEDKDSLKSSLFSAPSNETADSNESDALGAAASLRARLLKIRERNKTGNGFTAEAKSSDTVRSREEESKASSSQLSDENKVTYHESITEPQSSDVSDSIEDEKYLHPTGHLDEYLTKIRQLLSRSLPLSEEDDEIIESTDVLKSLHAAVSQQPSLAVNLDPSDVAFLRGEIKDNANEVVETLTR